MTAGEKRRAVVTGIGVVAPTGVGVEAYWKATAEGVTALGPITREGCGHFPMRVAGEVRGFDPQAMVEDTFLVQTDRFSHFAMAAAQMALADARLGRGDLTDPFSVGVVTAAGSGGGEFGQRELQKLWANGPKHVGPYQSIAWFYAASTGQISIRGGFKGPCGVVASDEAGGLDALAHGDREVRRGTDTLVVGAAEAPLAPYSMACQLGYAELSRESEPDRAYRPFTPSACGFVPAEGGAVLLLEEAGTARARGADLRATVAGHAATFTGASQWEKSREGSRTPSRARSRRRAAAPETWTWSSPTRSAPRGGPGGGAGAGRRPRPARPPGAGDRAQDGHRTGLLRLGGAGRGGGRARHGARSGAAHPERLRRLPRPGPRRRPCPAAELRTALVLNRGLMGSNSALVLRHGATGSDE